MRGISVPDRENDYAADVVELFFDLAFVFAFSRLVAELAHDHDWPAAGRTLLTFLMIWFAWTQFTWAANTVPGNQRVVRVVFLVATITSIPMAASVNSALSGGGAVFALSLALIVALGQGLLLLNVDHEADGFRNMMQLSIMTTIAVGLSVVGGFVDATPRIVLWTLAIVTFLAAMTSRAGRSGWIIRPGHMSERHGLIIIVALGEVVVAVGAPVVQGLTEGAGLPTPTLLSLVGAGGFVVLLWWSIFDRLHPSMEVFMEKLREKKRVSFARDVYTLIYMPIVAGIIVSAAALEEIALHPDQPIDPAFRLMFVAGVSLKAAGVMAAPYRADRIFARERLFALLAALGAIVLLVDAQAWLVLLVVDFVYLSAFIIEYRHVEAPYRDEKVDARAKVKGLVWVGSACADPEATANFFARSLGLHLTTQLSNFTRLTTPNGDRIEFFGPGFIEHDHLDTGPVAGFLVDDAQLAHDRLVADGTADVTEVSSSADGHRWFYFRAPDGNYYELTEHARARPARSEVDA